MKSNASKIFSVIIFVAFAVLSVSSTLAAKNCYVGEAGVWDGDYEIGTVEDVQALSGYTSVTGLLGIDVPSEELTSLEGLECLTYVGSLRISMTGGSGLTNLKGLEGLKSIGGDLEMSLVRFTSLEGLEGLKSIGGNLLIYLCSTTNLKGLESLKSVGGSMYLAENGGLTSLEGLKRLKSVGGSLFLSENWGLTSFKGLESLQSVGALEIEYQNVTSLEGFESLKSIGGSLRIGYFPHATSLEGFESLKSIGGNLIIQVFDSLTSLEGFKSLKSVGGDLTVFANPELCTSLAEDFADYLRDSGILDGDVFIFDNKNCYNMLSKERIH